MTDSVFYSGTSGLLLPQKNKSLYPPEFREKSRLFYYSSLFNSIEINSSFYRVPKLATVQRWADETTDNFRFTFKLWRGITHSPELGFDMSDVATFVRVITGAADKAGCLLVQFPPSLRINLRYRVENLLSEIRSRSTSQAYRICLEFRHPSWYRPETFRLLERYDAGMVMHDKTGSESPMLDSKMNFQYIRFHGPGGDYKGDYEEAVLHEYAGYIREWLNDGKDVFAYFNNTIGQAIPNLMTLRSLV